MERDISMDFIWSAVDWEPLASTSPVGYTLNTPVNGTEENTFIHLKEIISCFGKCFFTVLLSIR